MDMHFDVANAEGSARLQPAFRLPLRGLKHRATSALGAVCIVLLATPCSLRAAGPKEIVIDFEQTEIGKPIPTWTDQGVVFGLAGEPTRSKAKGRVMFFPHLATNRKGILNAMANEQAIPLQAKFPDGASSVTLVLWGSTGCPAKLEAFDQHDQLVDSVSLASVPGRKSPADPVPQFELTVKGPAIATIRLSGPRNGEFLAADELRFLPLATTQK